MNLSNTNLRARDIRKLVTPKLHRVVWHPGPNPTSEWVTASLETADDANNLKLWLLSKNIDPNEKAIWVSESWSITKHITFDNLVKNIDNYFVGSDFYIISSSKSWLLNFNALGIARFGNFPI